MHGPMRLARYTFHAYAQAIYLIDETEEIIDYIQHIEEKFDKQEVIDFRDKFMSACDGKVTNFCEEAAAYTNTKPVYLYIPEFK